LVAIAISVLSLLAFAQSVSADAVIAEAGEGAGQVASPAGLAVDTSTAESTSGRLYVADRANHRVDVFDSEGHFAMAFGWGVVDGAGELQTCGPAAPVPTVTCRKGLEGGGAGEFTVPEEIAVDNDPASPSQHDIYVLDLGKDEYRGEGRGDRVEKFTPAGEFLLTWGGGVITAGAAGTGNLSAGSTIVSNVVTTARAFEAGQTILAPGKVPAGTTIVAVGVGAITLSRPATASGTAVALSVAAGPGNVAANEVLTLTLNGEPNGQFSIGFRTPNPSPTEASTAQDISGTDTAAEIQSELEGLANIGPGDVAVSGSPGGPYAIEFKGSRFANTNVGLYEDGGAGSPRFIATPNGDSTAEICTAAIAANCAGGVEGSGDGQFDESRAAVHLAVGPDGAVYVADCVVIALDSSLTPSCKDRVQEFEPSGVFIKALPLSQSEQEPSALAVDSSGDFYLSTRDGIRRKYDPSGSLLETVPIGSTALAVDPSDDLFVSEGQTIAEYDSAGDTLRRFGYGAIKEGATAEGLAPYHSATGDVYVSEPSGSRILHLDFSPPGPVILPAPCKASFLGNTKATLQAEINPEGKATTIRFQYITDKAFEENGNSFSGAHPATSTPESASIGSDFVPDAASAEATLVPETQYRCRAIATNADAPAGILGEEGAFTSLPPLQIGATWSSAVWSEGATLNTEVNPLGIPTTGYFEYVDEATYQANTKKAEEAAKSPKEVQEAGFEHAVKVPAEPIDFGEGESPKAGTAAISGLVPGVAYRYRVVATDHFFEIGFPGPVETLRTFRLGEGGLPDGRVWELVSPAQKNSAEVGVGEPDGGVTTYPSYRLIDAGATSGEAITYTSWTSFGEPESAPSVGQYFSRRTEDGWETENISPSVPAPKQLIPPFRGFSADLGFGALVTGQPIASGEVLDNLYLRDDGTGTLQELTTEAPKIAAKVELCLDYAGSSEDGSRAFFAADASYAGTLEAKGLNKEFSLYEWSAAKGLVPLSVLPGKSISVAPSPNTAFGAGLSGSGHCQTGETVMRHVISADGRIAFWTYAPQSGTPELLARVGGEETIQLDKKVAGGTGNSGEGVFQGASIDGSKAFFTDKSNLKGGASEGDLYLYELVGKELKDLTPGTEAAGVKGVAGISDDGSYIYFVAEGALTGTEANAAGEKAIKGADNLYLYHEGEGVRFIGVLASEDQGDWSSNPSTLSARVTPDGRHLMFLSLEAQALAGYDNTVSVGAHCQLPNSKGEALQGSPDCPEVFLYDAEANRLVCASCNPTGERPAGPTRLPTWSNPFEGPRYLSKDGSKLFFESDDALTPADENGKRDIYEFERDGTGNCTSESPNFDPVSGGCHFLLSSGKSTDESYLLDASGSGRDVFFSTRRALIGSDTNENYDVYDAREGGGFPEPSEQAPCLGEGCKPAPSLMSNPFLPATMMFSGAGNLAPPVAKAISKPKVKPLTRARKLTKALKACRSKRSKRKRAACEKSARKAYGRRK
jgi:Tol biopolymer transport system component